MEAGPAPEATPVDVDEIPLTLKVEIARIQMPVKMIRELQAGNILELDARPEQGVNLVTNGKTLARGELIRVGDTLGVRILHIGK